MQLQEEAASLCHRRSDENSSCLHVYKDVFSIFYVFLYGIDNVKIIDLSRGEARNGTSTEDRV